MVGSVTTKPMFSSTEEMLLSLISSSIVESIDETIRYLSFGSSCLPFRVITLNGFTGIGLAAISVTARPCVNCLKVPLLDLPHAK